jgi:hypothetical protein
MKRILLTAVLIVTVCLASFANHIVAQGHSNTVFGDYKIVALDDHLMFMNKELDKYQITYENTDLSVVVVVDKQKNCKKYYVLSEQFPVQYECNGTYFGIKKLDKSLEECGYVTIMENINKAEFFHQRVLTTGTTATADHLNLIASYFPGLFKGNVVKVS